MKFVFVLAGLIILAIGLVAYSAIPNIHSIPVQYAQPLIRNSNLHVGPNSSEQTQQDLHLVPGQNNEIQANVTVSLDSGGLSSAEFKIFRSDRFQECVVSSQGCLFDRLVSNGTITVPVNASATYYFGFDNTSSNSSKTVSLSASQLAITIRTLAARDGSWNLAGLGMGVIGLVVALYGVASKTIIPWE